MYLLGHEQQVFQLSRTELDALQSIDEVVYSTNAGQQHVESDTSEGPDICPIVRLQFGRQLRSQEMTTTCNVIKLFQRDKYQSQQNVSR